MKKTISALFAALALTFGATAFAATPATAPVAASPVVASAPAAKVVKKHHHFFKHHKHHAKRPLHLKPLGKLTPAQKQLYKGS
jgi:Skp family chaperone for outer membrane proteins